MPELVSRIATLRLHSSAANTAALRPRLASLLASADLRPPGVPVSAILILRHMDDPLPGRVLPRGGRPLLDSAWERAAQDAIRQCYQRAARPALGHILPTADAVLFADQAELLACLALDLSQGNANQHWWWHALLRGLPPAARTTVASLFIHSARELPALLHYLHTWGVAASVVGTCAPDLALLVLAALARAYALDLRHIIADDPHTHQPPDALPDLGLQTGIATSRADLLAPWQRSYRHIQIPPELGREQSCLLGLGLLLFERPALLHNAAFLHELRWWWAATSPTAPDHSHPAEQAHPPSTAIPAVVGGVSALASATTSAAFAHESTQAGERGGVRQLADQPNTPALPQAHGLIEAQPADLHTSQLPAMLPANLRQPDHPLPTQEPANESAESHPAGQSSQSFQTAETIASAQQEFRPAPELFPELGIATDLAGILFLINLMINLDLPDCFEPDWELATRVGPWSTLEALGRCLLGSSTRWATDQIWPTLALLDGRQPGTRPTDALPSQCFRLPPRWLEQLGDAEDGTFCWATNASHLRLWSAQGYLVLECPINTPAVAAIFRRRVFSIRGVPPHPQPLPHRWGGAHRVLKRLSPLAPAWERGLGGEGSRRESPPAPAVAHTALRETLGAGAAYTLVPAVYDAAPLELISGALTAEFGPELCRWLARALPAIRLRLVRALRQPEFERDLLLRTGRVYLTATSIDLILPLGAISLPVRMAGLDRDPGWMHDFGRVIKFHFE